MLWGSLYFDTHLKPKISQRAQDNAANNHVAGRERLKPGARPQEELAFPKRDCHTVLITYGNTLQEKIRPKTKLTQPWARQHPNQHGLIMQSFCHPLKLKFHTLYPENCYQSATRPPLSVSLPTVTTLNKSLLYSSRNYLFLWNIEDG